MWKKIVTWWQELRNKRKEPVSLTAAGQAITDLQYGRNTGAGIVGSFLSGIASLEVLCVLWERNLIRKEDIIEAVPSLDVPARTLAQQPAINAFLRKILPAETSAVQTKFPRGPIPSRLILHGLMEDYIRFDRGHNGDPHLHFNVSRWLEVFEQGMPPKDPASPLPLEKLN
jgi:hypothetical protein